MHMHTPKLSQHERSTVVCVQLNLSRENGTGNSKNPTFLVSQTRRMNQYMSHDVNSLDYLLSGCDSY